MELNFIVIGATSLIPLFLGFIWYHPKVFGNAWMQAAGMTDEKIKSANMGLIFGLTFVLSILFALSTPYLVIHQLHFFSTLANQSSLVDDPTSPAAILAKNFMDNYGHEFRTFKHGAFHGLLTGLFLALPIVGINALFERKGFKYIAINAGYWITALVIMGGIVCAYE